MITLTAPRRLPSATATHHGPAISLVAALLIGGSALFLGAIVSWACLMSLDAVTPASWSVLGTLACLGAAAIHAAAALAALRDLRRL